MSPKHVTINLSLAKMQQCKSHLQTYPLPKKQVTTCTMQTHNIAWHNFKLIWYLRKKLQLLPCCKNTMLQATSSNLYNEPQQNINLQLSTTTRNKHINSHTCKIHKQNSCIESELTYNLWNTNASHYKSQLQTHTMLQQNYNLCLVKQNTASGNFKLRQCPQNKSHLVPCKDTTLQVTTSNLSNNVKTSYNLCLAFKHLHELLTSSAAAPALASFIFLWCRPATFAMGAGTRSFCLCPMAVTAAKSASALAGTTSRRNFLVPPPGLHPCTLCNDHWDKQGTRLMMEGGGDEGQRKKNFGSISGKGEELTLVV